jgi:chromosome segregation ATPase
LDQRTRDLDVATRELTRCAGEFARAEVALGAAAAEAGALRQQIAERIDDVDAVKVELARCATEFSHAEAAIGAAAKEAAALRADLNQKTRDIRSLEDLLDGQTDDIARWRNAVEDLRRRLDAAEKSLSWRLTAPARAAFRLLIGR